MKEKRGNGLFPVKNVIILLAILLIALSSGGCNYVSGNGVNVLSKEDAKEYLLEKTKIEKFLEISMEVNFGDVEIIEGDDYYVEASYLYWKEAPSYDIKDGVLTFSDVNTLPKIYSILFQVNNKVKVYVPKDAKLKAIQIDDDLGDISATGFQAKNVKIASSYGDVKLKDVNADKIELELSSGYSKLENIDTIEMNYVNTYGDADFKDINLLQVKDNNVLKDSKLNISLSSGTCTINDMSGKWVSVLNSYGDVKLKDVNADIIELDLSSGYSKLENINTIEMDYVNTYGDADFKDINLLQVKDNNVPKDSEFHISLSSGTCTINDMSGNRVSVLNSYGDVNCNRLYAEEFSTELSSGTLFVRDGDVKIVNVLNNYGDADIELIGGGNEYSTNIISSYGDIYVAGEKYETVYKRNTTRDRELRVELSSGTAKINFIE